MAEYYLCLHEGCNLAFPTYNALTGHYMGKHKGEKRPSKRECAVTELPEGYTLVGAEQKPGKGVTPQKENVYKQMPEPASILYRVLSEFPGIPGEVVDEVMSWVEYKGPLHPMEVSHLLSQMANVPKGAANIIPQKYQLAMQRAAQLGSSDVQMALSGWSQFGQQQGMGFGGISPMGQFGGQYGAPQGGFGQPPMGYPQYQPPQGPYYQPPYYPPYHGKESTETDKKFEQLGSNIDKLGSMFEALQGEVMRREEEKREDALNARLNQIENAISSIGQKGPAEADETTKELRQELSQIREQITANQISSLSSEVKSLRDRLSETSEDRIDRLESDLAEAKRAAEKTVGRTEMDVIGSAIDKGIEKASEAGKDIRAVVLAPHTREQFATGRKGAEVRGEQGAKLAKSAEREARITEKESKMPEPTTEVVS